MNRHQRRANEVTQAKGVVHHLIADTCKEMARAYWDESASAQNEVGNTFYKMFPDMEIFVARNWHRFNEFARSALVDLLGMAHHPSTGALITDAEKAEIYDALKLDGTLNARRVDTKVNKLITPGDMLLPSNGAPRNVH